MSDEKKNLISVRIFVFFLRFMKSENKILPEIRLFMRGNIAILYRNI